MRNPTERFSPERSASSSRTVSSPPASTVSTRKIAASVIGSRIGWGSGRLIYAVSATPASGVATWKLKLSST